jgi:TRAP-type mannitol/chloroaromatic compound transport system permease large subunit
VYPTESAAVGAVGALVLAALYQRLSWKMLQETSTETIKVTATMALATLKYFSALPKLHLLLLKIGAACGSR